MTAATAQEFIIGVDLGGTNIVTGALTPDGAHTCGVRSVPTEVASGAEGVVDHIVAAIEDTIAATMEETGVARDAFRGVGIGAPGPLDRERGVVIVAPNLGWRNFPLRDRVVERIGLPATLDNDANCATLGEWWLGAARGARHVIGLTIGTGIGGGLVFDGRLFHGASDVAGEIGHTTIDMDGRHCKCGNYGCLEAYASGPAIATRAREVLERDGAASLMPQMVGGDLTRLTAQTVYDAAKAGDPAADEIVRDTARYLGAAVANLLNIFNPDVVVIAGGVTLAGERLFAPLQAEVRRRAFAPAVEAARIVPGMLPGTAGVVGAARAYLER